jgi:23S rRNA (adenine2503-C2)-methyltransferase
MRSSSLFVTLQGGNFMIQLLGKNTAELEATLKEAGQPAFRGRQIAAWIYRKGATSFDEMTDLPKTLREQLSSTHEIGFPHVAAQHQSRDGSTKLLLQMGDNERIETVRLPYPDRVSVCVSSQAGCAMACQFCATGIGGFRRNLSTAEIIAQPLLAMTSDEKLRNVPTHIVFMGMGEPLLNLNNVLPTLSLMHEEMGIPYRISRFRRWELFPASSVWLK